MRARVAIVYNEPCRSRYDAVGEEKAVLGVLESVEAVHWALRQLDFEVIRVSLAPPLTQAKRKLRALQADLVFNLFEGFCGYPETEATAAEVISELGIPRTGCPGPELRLALDKAEVKMILKAAGIRTPCFQLLNPETLHMFQLSYPCIVKPRSEDASHGLSSESVVNDLAALERQVRFVSDIYKGSALVEEFVDGREFNATVLGDFECTVLPISEIVYSLPPEMPRILAFAAKWEPGSIYFQGTKPTCPADIGAEEHQLITETVLAAFRLLGGQGYARVDLRMDREGQLNVIEVNPNPDISPGSGAARQAEAAGMTYTQFIEKIVKLAFDEKSNEIQYSTYDWRRQTRHSENTGPYARIQAS
jgi:D-alanine-D-alanine ligase